MYLRFTDIDQSQQALRNYPANSPANIEGGGLPAGATGYQAIPIQTVSYALGYSHSFSPTYMRRRSSVSNGRGCTCRGTRLRWRTTNSSWVCPTTSARSGSRRSARTC